ncbi:Phosphoglycolate phosphatase [Gemmata obscuriglobus]|uniref:Carotenoid oxygenase n=1 Tax=Gemmata obscuriglobus TaxID=114 RepID=A0A2Z3HB40_9BACT|nr:HAD-IA family hydrolase [Gemmata obscuriglobus]AWM40727.1 carotenoid oxygenase [Gemmata obscuriglobus]QEG26001.1 Phosphoglycolate phosphatase [Gemmata obscuriglobus]VTS00284.1 carotenoid oxygenase : Haloacid dehalogenase-like hydrolase, putative OS=Coleofasciculus chthonoplastes PCC 7420 GN=MC7420_57 PE=4 SV=1: HAD_2 [Gemmata obscuriglobus UQM 2246]
MPFKLVVWDFDGTLADSLPTATAIFNRLAAEMGLEPIGDLSAARSLPTRQFLRQHGISMWRLPRLVRKYQAAAAEEADRLKLVTGLPEVLTALATSGMKLGILSSNREDNIRRCLRANGAEGHFAFVVGYPRLFGKAKALKRIIRAEQIDHSDVLYVGDELRDIEAAKKVGAKVAAVTWGFHTVELLRSGAPDFVVTTPGELLGIVGRP